MKKINIKTILTVLSFLVLFLILSTLAYFTSADSVTNRFTSNEFSVRVDEPDYKDGQTIGYGQKISKAPHVYNSGSNPAVVYLELSVPKKAGLVTVENGKLNLNIGAEVELFHFYSGETEGFHTKWKELDEDTDSNSNYNIYRFGYTAVVESKDSSKALFDEVQLKEIFEIDDSNENLNDLLDSYQQIQITAYGIQSKSLSDSEGTFEITDETAITESELIRIWNILKGA